MIITISGKTGTGKSTAARILADRLGYKKYSMGDLRGKVAMERGITIDELNKIGESDPTTDTSVDEYQKKLGEQEDNFVVEGRISWHFIPRAFKVYLKCEQMEAARRIFEARKVEPETRADEPMYQSIQDTATVLAERDASDARRYEMIYQIDCNDLSHYDLVVDTTPHAGPEETVQIIWDRLKQEGKI